MGMFSTSGEQLDPPEKDVKFETSDIGPELNEASHENTISGELLDSLRDFKGAFKSAEEDADLDAEEQTSEDATSDDVSQEFDGDIGIDEAEIISNSHSPDVDVSREGLESENERSSSLGEDNKLEQQFAVLSEMISRFDVIQRQSEVLQERCRAQDETIRGLMKTVDELQAERINDVLKPVLKMLANLLTDSESSLAQARLQEDNDKVQAFEYYVEKIVETIELMGYRSAEAAPEKEFDRIRHAAKRRISTNDPSLDKKIEKVHLQGIVKGDVDQRALFPALVNVYRYVPEEIS